MINKKILVFGITFLLGIFLINFVSSETSYCCEKTKSTTTGGSNPGGNCIDAPQEDCEIGNICGKDGNQKCREVPSSCEATSYCKLGTCIYEGAGDCTDNTNRIVCENSGGIWKVQKPEELPQCQLGCCLIGGQAAFVTPTRCSTLSTLYGVNINFRKDIQTEFECISSATADIEGACVIDREFGRTCKRLTRKECTELGTTEGVGEVSFSERYLCSAPDLGADCDKTDRTTCVEDKDEVYFVDSCGNIANVYYSNKLTDDPYWTYIAGTNDVAVCDDGAGNKNSATCGNCDYYSGSTCKKYQRGDLRNPISGDYICKDLGCSYDSDGNGRVDLATETYQHGETWCADINDKKKIGSAGNIVLDTVGGTNLGDKEKIDFGGRYFRMVCYNGEVTVEPCADFRQEICIQSSVTGGDGKPFKTAACRVNKWQDCAVQNDSESCNNIVQRDCNWVPFQIGEVGEKGGTQIPILGIGGGSTIKVIDSGICVPKYKPGLNFWNSESDADAICSRGSQQCIALKIGELEAKQLKLSTDVQNTYEGVCVDSKTGEVTPAWVNQRNNICQAVADCVGEYTETGYEKITQEGGGFTKQQTLIKT